ARGSVGMCAAAQAEENAAAHMPTEPRAAQSMSEKDWIKNARRRRWTSTLTYVGSWLLTIGIGGFIISTAAVVVLGPKMVLEKSQTLWSTGLQLKAAPKPVSTNRPTKAPSVAVVNVKPVSVILSTANGNAAPDVTD
ncbi:MAG: hypothetical protein AAFO75_14270, partial [Pseudomonadota bacterium]